jgi:glycosyltransferase involved in cell wall biosynthesis
MRVLTISNYFPPSDVGGAEIAAHNTCYGLRQQGVDVSVLAITARAHRREDSHYTINGIPVHRVSIPKSVPSRYLQAFDPRVYREVRGELHRTAPDLVHIHNVSGASLAPFLACRLRGLPAVLTLHDHWLLCPNNLLLRKGGALCNPTECNSASRQCFRRYDFWASIPRRRQVFARAVANVRAFISPSQKLIDLHAAAGYDRARFRVVRYGIQPALTRIPSAPLARQVVLDRGLPRTLLFSGMVVENKGIQTLIEALPRISERLPDARLVVAGTGDADYMTALGAVGGPRVVLLGRLPFQEMRSLYAAADLTLVPSVWHDNSPMVIYESLLAGTPVAGSAIGGIPELIEHGRTGYLFPAGDAVALAEQVIQHFSRPAIERRSMRRRCVETATAELTLDRHIERLLPIYREALDG